MVAGRNRPGHSHLPQDRHRRQGNLDAMMRSAVLLQTAWLLMACAALRADDDPPYLYVLGVAQDAGYPQAGCYEPHCMPGWDDPRLERGATSIALLKSSFCFAVGLNGLRMKAMFPVMP